MNRGAWRSAVVAVAVLSGAGCGGLADATGHGAVSLTVSGGFAGVDQGIEVAPDGAVRTTDRGTARAARALSEKERDDLDSLLDQVDFDRLPARTVSATGRDLFAYRVEYQGHTVITDKSRDLGALDTVIERLGHYLDERRGER
ncbi:hypothetical protein [Streptomyces sp. cg35]|uniref:hypothetical protein n=1 Tax=Streptomyces sp. cg35 TaxID=3421650 RepID=UPI003D181C8E